MVDYSLLLPYKLHSLKALLVSWLQEVLDLVPFPFSLVFNLYNGITIPQLGMHDFDWLNMEVGQLRGSAMLLLVLSAEVFYSTVKTLHHTKKILTFSICAGKTMSMTNTEVVYNLF